MDLKAWIKNNPNHKWRRGDHNEGKVFWCYSSTKKNGEFWLPVEKFVAKLQREKKSSASFRKIHSSEIRKKWRAKNPKKIRIKQPDEERLEKARARAAKIFASTPGKVREYQKRWRALHPDRIRKLQKDHRAKNRARYAAYSRCRAMKKSNQLHPSHNYDIEFALEEMRIRLELCIGNKWSIDHIIPINVGGSHAHWNLQVIPSIWNSRKQDNQFFRLPDCYISIKKF